MSKPEGVRNNSARSVLSNAVGQIADQLIGNPKPPAGRGPRVEQLEARRMWSQTPTIGDLKLVNDTGVSGDNATTDFRVSGRVTGITLTAASPVQFDVNGDGSVDGTVYATADTSGFFEANLSSFVYNPGGVTVKFRAGTADSNTGGTVYGSWSSFSFTAQTGTATTPNNEPTTHLPTTSTVGNAVLNTASLRPGMSVTGTSPVLSGPAVYGGTFASWANRFDPAGGTAVSIDESDSDATPVITSYTADNGTYTVSTADTFHHVVNCTVGSAEEWSYSEAYTSTVLISTTFVGSNGAKWSRTQQSAHDYTLVASTDYDGQNTTYTATEKRNDNYTYHWQNAAAWPTHVYDASGGQKLNLTASGERSESNNSGDVISSETINYTASGTDDYLNNGSGNEFDVQWSSYNKVAAPWSVHAVSTATAAYGGQASQTNFTYTSGHNEQDSNVRATHLNRNSGDEQETAQYVTSAGGQFGVTEVLQGQVNRSEANESGWNKADVYKSRDAGYVYNGTSTVNTHTTGATAVDATSKTVSTSNQSNSLSSHDYGYTTYAGGSATGFSGTSQSNSKVASTWGVNGTAHSTGTDTGTAGTTRSFTSDQTRTDSGNATTTVASNAARAFAGGAVVTTSTTTTTTNSTGKSSWNSADASQLDSTVTDGGTTTHTYGSSKSTDKGTGNYSAYSQGVASNGSNSGSTNHTATNSGSTTAEHDYTTDVKTVDNVGGISRSLTGLTNTTQNTAGGYVATSTGSGTYSGTNHTTTETTKRDDQGSSDSHTTSSGTSDVTDSSTPGIVKNSKGNTDSSEDMTGVLYKGSSTYTTTDTNGTISWTDVGFREDAGARAFESSDKGTVKVADNAVTGVTRTTTTTNAGSKGGGGKWKSHYDTDGQGNGSSYTSSTTNASEDSGTYEVESSTQVESTGKDSSTSLVKSFTYSSSDDSAGEGTYESTSNSSEQSSSDGDYAYTAGTTYDSTDSGTYSNKSDSKTSTTGSSNPSSGVTITVTKGDDHYYEFRDGKYQTDQKQQTSTENDGGQTTSSSSNSTLNHAEGTSEWSADTASTSTTTDKSTPSVTKTSKNTTNTDGQGGGKWSQDFENTSNTDNDGSYTSSDTSSETSQGTGTTQSDVETSSDYTDDSKSGINKTAHSDTTSHDEGTSTYSNIAESKSEHPSDGEDTSWSHTYNETGSSGTTGGTFDETATTKTFTSAANGSNNATGDAVWRNVNGESTTVVSRHNDGDFASKSMRDSVTTDGETTGWSSASRDETGTFGGTTTADGTAKTLDNAGSGTDKSVDGTAESTRHSEDNYDGDYENHSTNSSTTSEDGTSTEDWSKYSESGSFDSAVDQTITSKNKSSTSKDNKSYVDTTKDDTESHDTSEGTYETNSESTTSADEDGNVTSYSQSDRQETGSNTYDTTRDLAVNSHSVSGGGQSPEITTDSEVTDTETNSGDGEYTSYTWGDSDGNAQSSQTSSGTYEWGSEYEGNTTKKTPASSSLGASGDDTWASTLTTNAEGTGTYSSDNNSETTDGVSSHDNYAEDSRKGTYDETRHDHAEHNDTDALTGIDGVTRTGSSTSTTDSHITGGETKSITTNLDKLDEDGSATSEVYTFESDKATTTWSSESAADGTDSGTDPNGNTVNRQTHNKTTESGTDEFNVSTGQTTTVADGETTVHGQQSGKGESNSTWDVSNANTALSSQGNVAVNSSDKSTDKGTSKTSYEYDWTSDTDRYGTITYGSGTNTIKANGDYTHDTESSFTVSDTVSTSDGKHTVERKDKTFNKDKGSYSVEGSVTVTSEDGSETEYAGSVTAKDDGTTDSGTTKSQTTTDEHTGGNGTKYWDSFTKNYSQTDKATRKVKTTSTYASDGTTSTDTDSKTTSKPTVSYEESHDWGWTGKAGDGRGIQYDGSSKSNSYVKISRGFDITTDNGQTTSTRTRSQEYGGSTQTDLTNGQAQGLAAAHESTSSGYKNTREDHAEENGASGTITTKDEKWDNHDWDIKWNNNYGDAGTTSGTQSTARGYTVTGGQSKLTSSEQHDKTNGQFTTYGGQGNGKSWTTSTNYDATLSGDRITGASKWTNSSLTPSSGSTPIDDAAGLGGIGFFFGGGTEDTWEIENYWANGLSGDVRNQLYGGQGAASSAGSVIGNVAASALEFAKGGADALAGSVDGFLNAINPLDSWISVPDIGPVFGHEGAYAGGQIAGTLGAVAASFAIGNAAGGTSGLIACGSLAQKAAKVYTAVDTIAGVARASQNIYENGSVGVGDALAFAPVLTMGAQKLRGVPQNCFAAGTEVLVGSADKPGLFGEKKIEDIRVGDEVWSRDQDDAAAPMELKEVTALYRHTVYDLQTLSVADETGNVEVLHVTDEHPFYVDGKGWTTSEKLLVGEVLVSSDGHVLKVVKNLDEKSVEGVTVYNFEVEGDHTYFVSDKDSTSYIWTHNSCDSTKLGEAMGETWRWKIGDDAHHIVAANSKNAVEARAILAKFKIGINDAVNGVWLPSSSRLKAVRGSLAAAHSRVHTARYFKEVTARLRTATDKSSAEAILQDIAAMLRSGNIPGH